MKLKNKEKRLCGGKLIVTDFKRLNPKEVLPLGDFNPEQLSEELAFFTPDGTIFINTRIAGSNVVSDIFKIFIPESRETLKQYQEEYGKKFANIKNFTDWEKYARAETDSEKVTQALAVLMVPIELKRRAIESAYYGKIRAFPS
jgi:hypothetical protein